ncbi:MAG: DnaA N-terminal domain-containing protein [Pseudomonadota bacterium]
MTSKLISSSATLLIFPELAQKVGLNAAIVLQQVHYWLNPKVNSNLIQGKYWVYNTYEQWQRQFSFWSLKTIRRIINELEEQELLISFIKRNPTPIKYYSINYEVLRSMGITPNHFTATRQATAGQSDQVNVSSTTCPAGQSDQEHLVKMTRIYNKDTKTTTKITNPPPPPPPSLAPTVASKLPEIKAGDKKQEDEEEDFQNIIQVWNEEIQSKLNRPKVSLDHTRRKKLGELLQNVFSNDVAQWNSYCKQIGNCRFLLGENSSGFKVTLGWALQPKNALKVLEGAIYDKPQPQSERRQYKEKSVPEFDEDIRQHCLENQYPDLWFEICKQLVRKISQPTFKSWFLEVTPAKLSDNQVVLQTVNSFRKEYIGSNFIPTLQEVLAAHFAKIREHHIEIEVREGG